MPMIAQVPLMRFAFLLLSLLLINASFCHDALAQAAEDGWRSTAADGAAPAFQWRMQANADALSIAIRPTMPLQESAESFNQRWAIQLWLADAAMVSARKALLQSNRDAVRHYEQLKRAEGYEAAHCQQELNNFLITALAAQQEIANYDPFFQLLLHLDSRSATKSNSGLMQIITQKNTGALADTFEAQIKPAGFMDIQTLKLRTISYRIALVPIQSASRGAVKESQLETLRIAPAWNAHALLYPESAFSEALWRDKALMFSAVANGHYVPQQADAVYGGACHGADGRFTAPTL
jgi:hypothetical protein